MLPCMPCIKPPPFFIIALRMATTPSLTKSLTAEAFY